MLGSNPEYFISAVMNGEVVVDDDACGLCGQEEFEPLAEQREYWLSFFQDTGYYHIEDAVLPGSEEEVEEHFEDDSEGDLRASM